MTMRFVGGIERRVIYNERRYNSANQSSYTFTAVDLGAASPGRLIIVGTFGHDAFDEAISVTVGGVSATRRARARINPTIDLWSVVDAANTTANIVVTLDGTGVHCGIDVWSAYGVQNPVPADTGSALTGGASTSVTLTVPIDGVVVAYAGNNGVGGSIALTNVDEDANYVADSFRYVAGSLSHAAAGSLNIPVTGSGPRIVAATWS